MTTKKMKPIKSMKDLKKGNWYIRAVITLTGYCHYEIFQVIKTPYVKQTPHGTYLLMDTKGNTSVEPYPCHVSDMLGHGKFGSKLYSYSGKAIKLLKKNIGSMKDYFFLINASSAPTEKDFQQELDDQDFHTYIDKTMIGIEY